MSSRKVFFAPPRGVRLSFIGPAFWSRAFWADQFRLRGAGSLVRLPAMSRG